MTREGPGPNSPSGTLTDSLSGSPLSGICAYAVDTTAHELRGYSTATMGSGRYTISGLPPGTDTVAFASCPSGPYPLSFSPPVAVVPGGVVQLNATLTRP